MRGVRASVRFATTTGNSSRVQAQALLAAQAAVAGIELVLDNSPPLVLFGTRLPARDFDLIMFTWMKGADVAGDVNLYGCNGEQNFMDYCSQPVTELLTASDSEVDAVARAVLVNEANAILAQDIPTLPLFNEPAFMAYTDRLHGARNNPSIQGPLWNVEDWWVTVFDAARPTIRMEPTRR